MRTLFIFFIVMPIVEMWLLIEVGSHIGAFNTIGLVVLTAFVGVMLLKRQGMHTLLRARSRLSQGEIPAREMIDGLFLGVAGALLLTPGFVTDIVGFACLIPGTRTLIIGFIGRHIRLHTFDKTHHSTVFYSTTFAHKTDKNKIIEGQVDHDDKHSD